MVGPPFTVITEREYDLIRIPLMAAALDPATEALIEQDLEDAYPPVYESDIEHTEDYKDYRSTIRGLAASTPKFLRHILGSIEKTTMTDLKASAVFTAACDAGDVLAVVAEAEVVVGLQGQFSLIATETAYERLSQAGPPKLSFSAYCNENKELRRQLDSLGQPVNPRQATIRFLSRLIRIPGQWDNYIDQLFITLPTVEACQIELQALQKLISALTSMRPTPTIKSEIEPEPNARHDVPVMAFQGAPRNTEETSNCWNCDKPRHGWRQKCPAVLALCKTCNRTGHLTKNHQAWAKGTPNNANRSTDEAGKTSIANQAILDEDEDGDYSSWALACTVSSATSEGAMD